MKRSIPLLKTLFFSDGAAAAIVGKVPKSTETPLYKIVKQSCLAMENSTAHMTWEASDSGMIMQLSSRVPVNIKNHINTFSRSLLPLEIPFSACDWAIHPGGKTILKAIEKACALERKQTQVSWDVLSKYGNMSSATFLFVLDALQNTNSLKQWVLGLGFGPGLSVEGILLERGLK